MSGKYSTRVWDSVDWNVLEDSIQQSGPATAADIRTMRRGERDQQLRKLYSSSSHCTIILYNPSLVSDLSISLLTQTSATVLFYSGASNNKM